MTGFNHFGLTSGKEESAINVEWINVIHAYYLVGVHVQFETVFSPIDDQIERVPTDADRPLSGYVKDTEPRRSWNRILKAQSADRWLPIGDAPESGELPTGGGRQVRAAQATLAG